MSDNLPPLPDTPYSLYYEWPDDEDGYGGSEVIADNGYTADQMRAYAAAAVAAERERCGRVYGSREVAMSDEIQRLRAEVKALRELWDEAEMENDSLRVEAPTPALRRAAERSIVAWTVVRGGVWDPNA